MFYYLHHRVRPPNMFFFLMFLLEKKILRHLKKTDENPLSPSEGQQQGVKTRTSTIYQRRIP